jgi:2-dehydro-3-deoxyphosphooctonate aldolase (KDO 8-P synthase)
MIGLPGVDLVILSAIVRKGILQMYEPPAPLFQRDVPFVIIAGPCVLEGNQGELNRKVAERLKKIMASRPVHFFFKSSYDKANRTSVDSYRGPGLEEGLGILSEIKRDNQVNILTDVHNIHEVAPAAEVVDMLQIPAFLCRQTDLLVEAGKTGKAINIKKGQFLSPHEVAHGANKVKTTGNQQIYITERGTTFGYNNLVVDMRSIPIVQSLGLPLIFDATHSVQLPGGQGTSSGGQRQFVTTLARAAVAAGCNGIFFETHPDPDQAPCDGSNMIPLDWVEDMVDTCLRIREALVPSAPLASESFLREASKEINQQALVV